MLELTIRLIVSLAIVVGLLLVLAKFGARKFRGNAGALVHVVHRQALSRTSSVSVVTVGSRVLVLGTTEQQISVLTELDPDELELDEVAELTLLPQAQDEDLLALVTGPTGEPTVEPSAERAVETVVEPPAARRTPGSHRGSHRAAPAARTGAAPATGPLAGSVLSPQTWKQAFSAVSRSTTRESARRAS